MVEPTFSTTTLCAAFSKLFGESVDPNVLHTNKSRGFWPLEEGGRGWTRYGLSDSTRLYVMLGLRRQGVDLSRARHAAAAQQWWPDLGAQHHFLVASDGEPELAREKDLAERIAEGKGCSAIIVDLKTATERLKAALAELGEQVDLPDHFAAAVRAKAKVKP
jgi:hypothetical protein